MHRLFSPQTLLKLALPAALLLGVAAGALAQEEGPPDMALPTYIVQAGAAAPANAELLSFFPNDVAVHRGDTVTWVIAGFHNVHFEEAPAPLIVPAEVNGEEALVLNPQVAFPIGEGVFSGGEVNSGLPGEIPAYTLLIDAEPGTYTYFCDIHPGMSGTLTVVPDDQPTPPPQAVQLAAAAEIGAAVGEAFENYFTALATTEMIPEGDAQVLAGTGVVAANQLFLPGTVVIDAGDSVTWTLNADSREIHTISWPPFPPNSEFIPVEQEGGPPALVVGPIFQNTVESGAEIGQGDSFNYVIFPGDTFSLTFTDPGVYFYYCAIHVGMNGTVVVQPDGAA